MEGWDTCRSGHLLRIVCVSTYGTYARRWCRTKLDFLNTLNLGYSIVFVKLQFFSSKSTLCTYVGTVPTNTVTSTYVLHTINNYCPEQEGCFTTKVSVVIFAVLLLYSFNTSLPKVPPPSFVLLSCLPKNCSDGGGRNEGRTKGTACFSLSLSLSDFRPSRSISGGEVCAWRETCAMDEGLFLGSNISQIRSES